ncbi:dTDP-4-dehydrorhamnose 3,5-epimerase [Zooshikella sp. RANM57]|uniref:dTDP-4-dehydrorhamnose 3,5-epimerase n=1 Tax=Zooshikella sp. RANM57 TaxID=3425863 RepID=UPI003D6FBF39
MKVINTKIPDLKIIEPTIYEDNRGIFFEAWNQNKFESQVSKCKLVQDNHLKSRKGVLRGLHYQLSPYEQGQLVRVVEGSIYDVAVDIRRDSPTYGKHVSVELTGENKKMLWIPEGFAHGFVTLEDNTHVSYKTTNYYNKESEASIFWNSPELDINWPITSDLITSDKDRNAPLFSDAKLDINSYIIKPKGNYYKYDFPVIGDDRGSLIALEKRKEIPFDIKRVYYIYDTKKGVSRGFHAHRKLEQVIICLSGKCSLILDDGIKRKKVDLESPNVGLYIRNMIWREMHDFSSDCVLMVLASEHYNESDYIRDYSCFIKEIKDEQK